MDFRYQLGYQLTKILRCSHKQAYAFCRNGQIQIDEVVETNPRRTISSHEEIRLDALIIREGVAHQYVLFNKPNLYECTTNREIENNMYEILPSEYQQLFSLGRLDKNSEGLLLLTNDGQTYRKLMAEDAEVEKEYLVRTLRPLTPELEEAFVHPYLLGQRLTQPARFEHVDEYSFKVVLKEGINRHIRRICAKNNNQVMQLVRTRFGQHTLGDLQSGQWRAVDCFL